jgi:hypothetical protein
MYVRRKIRNRIILGLILVLGFITWRGLKATTEKSFNCEYKLVYAVCKPKAGSPKLPGMIDILKAGVKF